MSKMRSKPSTIVYDALMTIVWIMGQSYITDDVIYIVDIIDFFLAATKHNKPVSSLAEVKSTEMAKQLCLHEMSLFCQIDICQLRCHIWYKEENRSRNAPSLNAMTSWFNKVGLVVDGVVDDIILLINIISNNRCISSCRLTNFSSVPGWLRRSWGVTSNQESTNLKKRSDSQKSVAFWATTTPSWRYLPVSTPSPSFASRRPGRYGFESRRLHFLRFLAHPYRNSQTNIEQYIKIYPT